MGLSLNLSFGCIQVPAHVFKSQSELHNFSYTKYTHLPQYNKFPFFRSVVGRIMATKSPCPNSQNLLVCFLFLDYKKLCRYD